MLGRNRQLSILGERGVRVVRDSTIFSFSLSTILLTSFTRLPHIGPTGVISLYTKGKTISFLLAKGAGGPVVKIRLRSQLISVTHEAIRLGRLRRGISFLRTSIGSIAHFVGPSSISIVAYGPPCFGLDRSDFAGRLSTFTVTQRRVRLALSRLVGRADRLLGVGNGTCFIRHPSHLVRVLRAVHGGQVTPGGLRFVCPGRDGRTGVVLVRNVGSNGRSNFHILPPLIICGRRKRCDRGMGSILCNRR